MMQNHIPDKLRGDVRLHQSIQRMRGAEGVPQTESAVICLSLRHLLDLEIRVHITPVDVAHRVRLHQNVIKSGVENGLLVVGAFNVDASEFFLPNVVRVFHIFIKIPTLSLSEHILTCAFIIDRRNSDFHDKLPIIIIKTQSRAQCATVYHIAVADIQAAIHQDMFADWLRELGTEIDLAQLSPSADDTITFDSIVINNSYLSLDDVVITTT